MSQRLTAGWGIALVIATGVVTGAVVLTQGMPFLMTAAVTTTSVSVDDPPDGEEDGDSSFGTEQEDTYCCVRPGFEECNGPHTETECRAMNPEYMTKGTFGECSEICEGITPDSSSSESSSSAGPIDIYVSIGGCSQTMGRYKYIFTLGNMGPGTATAVEGSISVSQDSIYAPSIAPVQDGDTDPISGFPISPTLVYWAGGTLDSADMVSFSLEFEELSAVPGVIGIEWKASGTETNLQNNRFTVATAGVYCGGSTSSVSTSQVSSTPPVSSGASSGASSAVSSTSVSMSSHASSLSTSSSVSSFNSCKCPGGFVNWYDSFEPSGQPDWECLAGGLTCPVDSDPGVVCGCNGVTYPSVCAAYAAGVQTTTPGPCGSSSSFSTSQASSATSSSTTSSSAGSSSSSSSSGPVDVRVSLSCPCDGDNYGCMITVSNTGAEPATDMNVLLTVAGDRLDMAATEALTGPNGQELDIYSASQNTISWEGTLGGYSTVSVPLGFIDAANGGQLTLLAGTSAQDSNPANNGPISIAAPEACTSSSASSGSSDSSLPGLWGCCRNGIYTFGGTAQGFPRSDCSWQKTITVSMSQYLQSQGGAPSQAAADTNACENNTYTSSTGSSGGSSGGSSSGGSSSATSSTSSTSTSSGSSDSSDSSSSDSSSSKPPNWMFSRVIGQSYCSVFDDATYDADPELYSIVSGSVYNLAQCNQFANKAAQNSVCELSDGCKLLNVYDCVLKYNGYVWGADVNGKSYGGLCESKFD